ncbi:hypothetical protein [Sporosarcina jiandibaonis]|uniref:hypothetical protein n=1 Tax=Sporosarcina jiandibaonis TaxID=2715535 RepID=UPI001555EEE6|nr:hypothetical protein [Sporosarcina jiandibaonis]
MWVPKKLKARFLKAAIDNEVKCDELITRWISNYADEHEENKAAEQLHNAADRIKKAITH